MTKRTVLLWLGCLVLGALAMRDYLAYRLDVPLISYPVQPFPVESPVKAGDLAPMRVHRCNASGEPIQVPFSRVLYALDSGVAYTLSSGDTLIPPGCEDVVSGVMQVPADAIPGRYPVQAIDPCLWNVFPIDPLQNPPNGSPLHAVFDSQRRAGCASGGALANRNNILLGQLSHAMLFSEVHPSLLYCIGHVAVVIGQKEMIGPHTLAIVAAMAYVDSVRDRAYMKPKGNSMGQFCMPMVAEFSIPSSASRWFPYPTGSQALTDLRSVLVDMTHKSALGLFNWLGDRGVLASGATHLSTFRRVFKSTDDGRSDICSPLGAHRPSFTTNITTRNRAEFSVMACSGGEQLTAYKACSLSVGSLVCHDRILQKITGKFQHQEELAGAVKSPGRWGREFVVAWESAVFEVVR